MIAFRIVQFIAMSGQRHRISGFSVLFDNLNAAFKLRVVQQIPVDLPVFGDENVNILDKLGPRYAGFCLMKPVPAVWEVFAFRISVFIANQDIPFGFFRVFIGAGITQEQLELRALLRRLNPCGTVVAVLQDRHAALDHLFTRVHRDFVVFQFVQLRFRTDMVNLRVQQVALAGFYLLDGPIIAADIPIRCKFTVRPGKITAHQLPAFVYAVFGVFQAGVALGRTRFHIGFRQSGTPFFQYIVERLVRYLIPFNRGLLCFRHHIFVLNPDFFQRVRRIAGDQNILEGGDAALIGYCIFIHRQTGQAGTIQMECLILHKAVLSGFGNGQIPALEGIAEGHSARLARKNRHPFGCLRLIFILRQLGYFINARPQVFQQEGPVRLGADILIDAFPGNVERDIFHLSVLAGFYQLDAAERFGFDVYIEPDRVIQAGYHCLIARRSP